MVEAGMIRCRSLPSPSQEEGSPTLPPPGGVVTLSRDGGEGKDKVKRIYTIYLIGWRSNGMVNMFQIHHINPFLFILLENLLMVLLS